MELDAIARVEQPVEREPVALVVGELVVGQRAHARLRALLEHRREQLLA
jgi:hypothetical protein